MIIRFSVFLMWLLHFLPLPVLAWFGSGVGMVSYVLAAERRKVADINLHLCFPEMGKAERMRLIRAHFRVFGRAFIEHGILWWSSAERINNLVRVEGEEHMRALKGKAAILLTPHFVGLDAGGSWIGQRLDVVCVYSKQKNRYLSDLMLKGRTRFGNQRLYSRQQGLRPIIKGLREGLPFIYPTDQDQTVKDGAFIPFFGVPAATLTTVPRLAKMTGAIVVPCITRMLPGGEGYVLKFYPPWENYPTGDDIADTRRINEFIEQRVLEMPEQYYWLHKRFKTRPEGEERFY